MARGTFELAGGTIEQNTADSNGGGIYLGKYGDEFFNPCLKLSGGTIQGNHAGSSSGGVGYSNSGKPVIELSGSPVVTGNTKGDSWLDNNINLIISFAKLTISGTLSKDARLGVTPGSSGSVEVFTSGWSSYNHGARYDTIFTSDDSDFVVLPSEDDKELMFHKHSMTYQKDDTTAGKITGTCTCGAEISAWLDGETERTYNGQPQTFEIETSDNWNDFSDDALEVTYYNNADHTRPVKLSGAPTDAGSYLAVLDGPDSAYATLAFSIKRGTPDLAVTASPAALTGGGRVTLTVTGAPKGAAVTVTCDDSSIYLTQEGGVWYADLPAAVKNYTFTVQTDATANYAASTANCTVFVTAQPVTPDPDPEPADPGSSSGGSTSVRRYNIEADAGRGGDISPDGRVRVRRGENQTFRITADDGWEIADVEVDGESVGAVERYTFENVRTDHTISVTFQQIVTEPEPPALPFTDVSEGDWYHDAVAFCWENGIMDGTSGTAFAPNMILTRAMMAQVLYNLADGTPAAAAGFPDVSPTAWYADAVNWAAANGYVTGYDNGLFGPEDDLTREQLAAILYRYAGSPAPAGTLDGFADAASASDYAVDALRWAVGEGLLTGKDGGRLDPTGTASRAELAQILARFAG